jgi:hypothetical protein
MIQFSDSAVDRNFTAISTAAVVAAIVAGFWLLGSPGKQRLLALDSQRVQDLSSMVSEINADLSPITPTGANAPAKALPKELPAHISDRYKDPDTQQPYSYQRISDQAYQLCANFAMASNSNQQSQNFPLGDARWQHPAGRHCYEFEKLAYQPK